MYWSHVQAEMILHLRARVPEQDIITPKICFGVQLSGFPFRTITLLIRCHRTGSEACSGNIYPNIDYADSLDLSGILKLSDRRLNACDKLFNNIFTTPSHNLGHLLPERHIPRYNLKQTLFPQEQRPVDLRTPLYRLQLEFTTNPDILIMNYIF